MMKEFAKKLSERLAKALKLKRIKGEYYIKVESPEEFRKIVRKSVRVEMAELMKENMQLKKRIKELEETIKAISDEKSKKVSEEIARQRRIISDIIKSGQFTLLFSPENPIEVLSDEGNPFVDEEGREHPYLQGLRFVQLPENVKIELILSHKKRGRSIKDLTFLSPYPPLTLSNLRFLIKDISTLVRSLKRGFLVTNITDEGYLLTGSLPVYLQTPKVKK